MLTGCDGSDLGQVRGKLESSRERVQVVFGTLLVASPARVGRQGSKSC